MPAIVTCLGMIVSDHLVWSFCRPIGQQHHAARTRTTRLQVDLLNRSEAILQTLLYPLAFAAAFRTGAAVAVIGQPRMPSLHGSGQSEGDFKPVAVGSRVIRLPESGARVRLFYPTNETTTSAKMAPYCTDGRQTSDGMAGLVGFRQVGLSFLLAHLADASSGCYSDAATDEQQRLPLLVYSHGYGGNMDMATYFMRQMAAKGMMVAAVEHLDGTASSTILKNGETLPFSPNLLSGREQLKQRAKELAEAAEILPKQYGPSSIFLGGHSYGAPSALLAAETNKVDGLILHDPALAMGNGMLENILNQPNTRRPPILSYTSDEYNRGGVTCGDVSLHCQGAFHGNFVDAPLWAPLWVMRPLSLLIPAAGPAGPEYVHDQLACSAHAFMMSKDPFDERVQASALFEFIP